MTVQITARVDESLNGRIEAISDEIDGTKADAIRLLLERGLKYDEITEEKEELRQENQRIRDQLAAANRRIDDANEIVEYVRQDRRMAQYRDRRQRLLDDANILKRWKWKLTGVPVEDIDED